MSINEFAKENRQRWLNMDTILDVAVELDEKLQHTLEMAMEYAQEENAMLTLRMLKSDVDRAFGAVRNMHYLGKQVSEAGDREADRAELRLWAQKEAS